MGEEIKNIMLDADETAFFSRELEYIKRQSYDTLYKDLKAFKLFPISMEADAGAQTITYRKYTKIGFAKVISDYADDPGRADVYGEETTVKIKRIGSSFGYDRDEIRASRLTGKQLDRKRADSAKMAIDQKLNSLAFSGDSTYNISGFINYSGITSYTVPADGTGTTKTWSTKTPDQIVRDLGGLVDAAVVASNGVEIPDTILLPLASYTYIANTRMTDGDSKTILKFFLDNNPFITSIEWVTELNTAGASSTKRMMAYKKDPMKITFELPLAFEQLSPQQKGYGFEVLCEAKTAGIIVYYPVSVVYGDGI